MKRHDIEAMIAEENDPKQRSFLIILNSINNSLVANTQVTASLNNKFEEHLERFEQKVEEDAELLNQGKGAWKVAAWVLGAAQSVVIAAIVYAANDIKAIHTALHEGQLTDARIEARIERLESKK
jgi:hypothetical protein